MSKIVDSLFKEKLLEHGFKKKGNYFVKQINQWLIGTVSYSVAHYHTPGHSFVSPDIGVGSLKINRKINEMEGGKNPYYPTIWLPLYQFLGNGWREWEFVDNEDNSLVSNEMFSDIFKCGEAYCNRLSDPIVFFEESMKDGMTNYKTIPVFLYLQGNKEKGLEYLDFWIDRKTSLQTDKETYSSLKLNQCKLFLYKRPSTTFEELLDGARHLAEGGKMVIRDFTINLTDSQMKILVQSLPPRAELLYRVKSHIEQAHWDFIEKYMLLE